jgi:hypothetical protein
MGADRTQPMTDDVHDALWVTYGYRLRDRYQGRFVFFGAQAATRGEVRELREWELDPKHKRIGTGKKKARVVADKPWSYAAFNQALRAPELRAHVPHVKYRAAHGFRRGIVGDLGDKYGSERLAGEWIGDKDVKVVKDSYVLEREDRMRKVAAGLGAEAPPKDGEPNIKDGEPNTIERNSPAQWARQGELVR